MARCMVSLSGRYTWNARIKQYRCAWLEAHSGLWTCNRNPSQQFLYKSQHLQLVELSKNTFVAHNRLYAHRCDWEMQQHKHTMPGHIHVISACGNCILSCARSFHRMATCLAAVRKLCVHRLLFWLHTTPAASHTCAGIQSCRD
jgi:hypothetical protein